VALLPGHCFSKIKESSSGGCRCFNQSIIMLPSSFPSYYCIIFYFSLSGLVGCWLLSSMRMESTFLISKKAIFVIIPQFFHLQNLVIKYEKGMKRLLAFMLEMI
jgi:hypothetical protein